MLQRTCTSGRCEMIWATRKTEQPPELCVIVWRTSRPVWDLNPTHTCQNTTTLAGAGDAKSLLWEKPVLQSFFNSTQGFEAIQFRVITPQFLEGWNRELSSSLVCTVYSLSVCPSGDMENRRGSIFLWRPHSKLGSHNNYGAVSWNLKWSSLSGSWWNQYVW